MPSHCCLLASQPAAGTRRKRQQELERGRRRREERTAMEDCSDCCFAEELATHCLLELLHHDSLIRR